MVSTKNPDTCDDGAFRPSHMNVIQLRLNADCQTNANCMPPTVLNSSLRCLGLHCIPVYDCGHTKEKLGMAAWQASHRKGKLSNISFSSRLYNVHDELSSRSSSWRVKQNGLSTAYGQLPVGSPECGVMQSSRLTYTHRLEKKTLNYLLHTGLTDLSATVG